MTYIIKHDFRRRNRQRIGPRRTRMTSSISLVLHQKIRSMRFCGTFAISACASPFDWHLVSEDPLSNGSGSL